MKIVKTASGKRRIRISKREWESMGKEAGWVKEAQVQPLQAQSTPEAEMGKLNQLKDVLNSQISKSNLLTGWSGAIGGPQVANQIKLLMGQLSTLIGGLQFVPENATPQANQVTQVAPQTQTQTQTQPQTQTQAQPQAEQAQQATPSTPTPIGEIQPQGMPVPIGVQPKA